MRKLTVLPIASSAFLIATIASAGIPTITPAGAALGFNITTYATVGFPLGIAVASNGNIIVSSLTSGRRFVWPDVDGQTIGTAITSAPSSSGAQAYATSGGKPYGGDGSRFVQFKDDGTVDHILTGVSATPYLGIWTNPINGHLIATSGAGLIDIDPLAAGGLGSFRVINAAVFGDGVSVSTDGQTAYVEQSPKINGYDITSGALVFSSPNFPSPDGTGVIRSTNPSLNGKIIVNDNNGTIYLLDPVTNTFITIATGGSRGDFTSPDTNNGTLFLDYADAVARLSCGVGCTIGSDPIIPFQVSYASNLDKGDSTVNITNTGANGAQLNGPGFGSPAGNVCVNVYAFSPDEQLVACCSCPITPNGLVSLSVVSDLVSNTLTGLRPNSVVIKLVSTAAGPTFTGTACTNSAATAGDANTFPLASGVLAWSTTLHVQAVGPPAVLGLTEVPFRSASLSREELASITGRCTAIIGNGSTFGVCRSCRAGGLGGLKK